MFLIHVITRELLCKKKLNKNNCIKYFMSQFINCFI